MQLIQLPKKALEEMIVKMDVIRVKYIEVKIILHTILLSYWKDYRRGGLSRIRKFLANKLMKWIEEMPVYERYLPDILIKHGNRHGMATFLKRRNNILKWLNWIWDSFRFDGFWCQNEYSSIRIRRFFFWYSP